VDGPRRPGPIAGGDPRAIAQLREPPDLTVLNATPIQALRIADRAAALTAAIFGEGAHRAAVERRRRLQQLLASPHGRSRRGQLSGRSRWGSSVAGSNRARMGSACQPGPVLSIVIRALNEEGRSTRRSSAVWPRAHRAEPRVDVEDRRERRLDRRTEIARRYDAVTVLG
jgi:hypothetical protein